jgi:S1-C subfamily serine protease
MNLLDVLITLFFISSLVRGTELGVLRQLLSTGGLFAGLFLGVLIQSKVIHLAHSPGSKALLALMVIIGCIGLLSSLGEYAGVWVKKRLENIPLRSLNTADRALGALMGGATLLLAIWLGATIFSNTPAGGLQKQIKNSVIIAQLNKTLPSAPSVVTRIGHLIDPNGFPNVFTGLEPTIDTNKPLPSIGELDGAVQKARASTVKIEGASCGGISNGSGFVADTDLVITNAHVVAGVTRPYVLDADGRHLAQVVLFDPELDIAVLHTSGLAGQPLQLHEGLVNNGTPAAILGYPGGGDFTANPAVIVEVFKAVGRDIYDQGETTREVYSLKGSVRPGNSGGPLVNKNGEVIGVIFAESATYDDVGYALTTDRVITALNNAKEHPVSADTGACRQ